MGNAPIYLSRTVVAAHLILTGYGHWLPNDPRGSGSSAVRKTELRELGDIHFGRKRVQPPRETLRGFYREAEPKLMHQAVWFDTPARDAMAQAVGQVISQNGYTCWALAILRNHLHAVIRTHRDKAEVMLEKLGAGTRERLHAVQAVPPAHPVWSERPYKVFLKSRQDVVGRIRYVRDNPMKEGLPPQDWGCVVPFTG